MSKSQVWQYQAIEAQPKETLNHSGLVGVYIYKHILENIWHYLVKMNFHIPKDSESNTGYMYNNSKAIVFIIASKQAI